MNRFGAPPFTALPVVIAALTLLLANAASSAEAATFTMQYSENERISRMIARTGQNGHLQFIAIDCKRSGGACRIYKAGIERVLGELLH